MNSIGLSAKLGNEKATFNLKVLTIAEENRIRQSFLGLNDKEQEEKSFELTAAALTEFLIGDIECSFIDADGNEKGTEVSAKDFFADKTPSRERIADYAFRAWLVSLQPTVDFK